MLSHYCIQQKKKLVRNKVGLFFEALFRHCFLHCSGLVSGLVHGRHKNCLKSHLVLALFQPCSSLVSALFRWSGPNAPLWDSFLAFFLALFQRRPQNKARNKVKKRTASSENLVPTLFRQSFFERNLGFALFRFFSVDFVL